MCKFATSTSSIMQLMLLVVAMTTVVKATTHPKFRLQEISENSATAEQPAASPDKANMQAIGLRCFKHPEVT